jgi:hypothetical protein
MDEAKRSGGLGERKAREAAEFAEGQTKERAGVALRYGVRALAQLRASFAWTRWTEWT